MLYVVATPIGNLEDITLRAIKVLRQVGLVAAEDTRRTGILMERYRIQTRMTSYHDHNEDQKAPVILAALESGTDVALVSDAGTPGISDPGYRLVLLAHERGIRSVPIPGPSAVTAALSVSAVPSERFTFLGFLPRKGKARQLILEEIALMEGATVLYEAPGRLARTLSDLVARCGPSRKAAVVREATKKFEQVIRGTLGELDHQISSAKGEITLVIEGAATGGDDELKWPVHQEVLLLESWGLERSEAMKRVARAHGLPRSAVYKNVVMDQNQI